MMKSFLLKLLVLTMAYVVVGCTPFQPAERTAFDELPPTYSNRLLKPTDRERWWEEFDDPELNTIVDEALGDNLTLKESWARLRQARALSFPIEPTGSRSSAISGSNMNCSVSVV